ncbi:MAG: hypothetical protein Q8N43_02630, partial [Candidatus Azambacteria bacterium]|nr:hypothetical protein [Candidatus Azambacteria bacterium]
MFKCSDIRSRLIGYQSKNKFVLNFSEEIKNSKQNSRYIPLVEAGEILGTSRDYLNVLVRRGKLRAVKLGRNWFTTDEWLSEFRTPAGKWEREEKAELASLRDASLAERLRRVESRFENFQTFKDREISKKVSTSVTSQEIQLFSRRLAPDEKTKILETIKERIKTADSNQFQNASKKLGISKSLKSWSRLKFSLASGLAVILLAVSLGLASGLINFFPEGGYPVGRQFSIDNFKASIFSDVFKNFPSDLPSFSRWLVSGLNKSISLFKSKSPSELAIESLESGKSKLLKPEETPYSINTLAEAEALDSGEALASAFAETTAGKQEGGITGGGISISGSEFKLLENRFSIVEADLKDQTDLINSELSLQKKTILGALEALFGIAKLVPIHPISTIVVQGQPATLTTYSIQPQTNTGFDRLSATYLTLASDATINGSLTVKSGGSFNSLSVSGNTSLNTLSLSSLTSTGNVIVGGTLAVTGTTTVTGLTVNGSLNIPGNTVLGNASSTNLTATNFWSTNGTITNLTSTNGTITNASTTYATLPTFWSTKGTITNASSTNLTATNFWSTNGTITNASTTYLTVGNNFWGSDGLFSGAIQTPLIWNSGTLTASTTGANPIIFATNSSERMRLDENGNILIATTTAPSGFGFNIATSTFTYGNQFISGGLGIGVATTTSGVLQTSGDASIGGNFYVSGNSTIAGNATVIGASSANTLTINSSITSNLIPDANSTRDIGSTAKYWANAYISTLTVNSISAASTTIGGTQSATFTINSDNVTADTETETLIFFRGTVVPNALLTWNAATSSKRFEFNQSLYINNGSASTTNPTFTIQSIASQTANALQIIDNNSSAYFTVNPVSSNTTMINASTTNLTVSGNLWSALNSTSTFNGNLLLANGSATAPSLAFANDTQTGLYKLSTSKMGFVTAGLDRLTVDETGNVGIGTTSPNNLLTLYKSQTGGTNISIYNPNAVGYTSLILGSDSTSASSSISFYNSSYPTSGLAGSLELRTSSSNDILIRSGRYTGVGTAITGPQATIDIGTNDAYNNTTVEEAIIRHNTTGTAANGLGAGLAFWGQDDTGANQQLGRISGVVEQASTTAGFGSYLSFWTKSGTNLAEKMRLTSSGQLALATTTIPSGFGANIATSTNIYGNLTVSGNSIFNNSSTTNATLTNFWSTAGNITNGTITNASTTYATLPTFWGTNGTITNASTTYLTVGSNIFLPAGVITNTNLANSSLTINGTAISLGASGTVTAAAGTLTGTTLNSTVVASSLTSLGTIANLVATNASTTYATLPTLWSSSATITGGSITGITDLTVADGGTGASTLTGILQGNGASAITGITGTTGWFPYFNGANTVLATYTIFVSTASNVGIGTTGPLAKL